MASAVMIVEHKAGKRQQQWKLTQAGDLISLSAPTNKRAAGFKQLLSSAFLPVGYPESVTPDYTGTTQGDLATVALHSYGPGWVLSAGFGLINRCEWMLCADFVAWNTVQAISSYVRGILSSHAVFKGVGVGSQVGSNGPA